MIPLLILAATVVMTSVLTSLHLYSQWKFTYWQKRGVPQLNPIFLYGDCKDLVKGNKSLAEYALENYKKFKAMGVPYGGIYIALRGILVPIAPELIKDIMNKNFECFTAHFSKRPKKINRILNKNLFNIEGEAWRATRKKLTPTFTSGKMKMMFETLLEKTQGLEQLAGKIAESGKPADIRDVLARFTTDVVASCGFGLECNSLKDSKSEFLEHGRLIFTPPKIKDHILRILLKALHFVSPQNYQVSEDFFRQVVGETIEYREKNKIHRKDFLHMMIQLKNRGVVDDDINVFDHSAKSDGTFDLDDVTAQCLIFFLAGFETSATAMTFALLELCEHPEIQAKVRQEAEEVLNKYNGRMTYEAMLELKYTEQVIEETMRKYPPVGVIPRVCTKKYTIPGTKTEIEPGTMVHISAWGLHTDPEYFPNPQKFDPERFTVENRRNIKEFTYLPFGEGPRMCLGLRFGLMQSKVGLVSLLKNYKFTLNEKTRLPLKMARTVITCVDGDVWVNIEKI
ncbi:unnamed protein product [Ceutorhynchus assimilis]|uniref:Cytochrome P450 n=1 Tax=Ceutorhynchus assimilis TaxID=467358 RepID=A0A9N9QM44_9CUCU|nr:unnamed protein product [Ceutorhynchus assimilis]